MKTRDKILTGVAQQIKLPHALLIIPDGNGRWTKRIGADISEGHKAGGKTMEKILDQLSRVDIEYLGIWGFSEDNWKREKGEIDEIMNVIENVISTNLPKLMQNNIRFFVLGKREKIEKEYPSLLKTIQEVTSKTALNTGKKLVLFIDYGERFQLEEFAKERLKDNSSSTYDLLSKINNGVPMFDMILRTSGEQRLSGFGPLAELAEFVSVEKNMPELNEKDILLALKEFSKRQRRFGGR